MHTEDPSSQSHAEASKSDSWYSWLGYDSWPSWKQTGQSLLSVLNGGLYFAVAKAGGNNLQQLLNLTGHSADTAVSAISACASLCYTMFTYKTLESLQLWPTSLASKMLAALAPFSAATFLAAGEEGAETISSLGRSEALAIGVMLYLFRMVNCVDASAKFPARLQEINSAWQQAWEQSDYQELARLLATALVTLGYTMSSTDGIYSSAETILGWMGMAEQESHPYALGASIVGACAVTPLILYWTHRGLRQLTNGGKVNAEGVNPDPTDLATYLALAPVAPAILGILGGATSANGDAFGRLGLPAEIVRVLSSAVYATCAGTPGLATLIRSCQSRSDQTAPAASSELKTPFLQHKQGAYGSMNINSIDDGRLESELA